MNSRQRRGAVLLSLSVLCAAAAFFGVLSVVEDADAKLGPRTTAYELDQDVAAYQPVTVRQLRRVSIPRRWLPGTAVTDPSELDGRIAAAPLAKGSLLQSDMLLAQPALAAGQEEIAIMVDADTGVAGTVDPGDQVNVFATFAATGGQPQQSRIIVTDARVIAIGPIAQNSQGQQGADPQVPVTFALSPQDAQRVAYAESFATRVRLALVAPGSPAVPQAQRTYTLSGDK